MARSACVVRNRGLLLALALVGVAFPPALAHAQAPAAKDGATPSASTSAAEPAFLKELPRPADVPASLLLPPPPPGPAPPPPEGPYFEKNPLLDSPWLPPVGCFFNAEVALVNAHVQNQLTGTVQVGDPSVRPPDTVFVNSAPLDLTVSPYFALGYRIPSGFGEVYLAYRFLITEGSDHILGPDGPADRRSRLDFNQIDLDYGSWEFSLWPHWQMKVLLGLRYVNLYFDSQLHQPFDLAAAGTGISDFRVTNSYVGIGPHTGVELRRCLDGSCFGCLGFLKDSGLSLGGRFDLTGLLGRIRQQFFETGAFFGPNGLPATGNTGFSSSQAVPAVQGRLGINWVPNQHAHFFLGYQGEYWWNVGRLSATGPVLNPSRGELAIQGLYVRAEFNF
jgi:hypothetical protein